MQIILFGLMVPLRVFPRLSETSFEAVARCGPAMPLQWPRGGQASHTAAKHGLPGKPRRVVIAEYTKYTVNLFFEAPPRWLIAPGGRMTALNRTWTVFGFSATFRQGSAVVQSAGQAPQRCAPQST